MFLIEENFMSWRGGLYFTRTDHSQATELIIEIEEYDADF